MAEGFPHASTPERLEAGLRQKLYRFDCPSAHQLGEYAIDMVGSAERVAIAQHALDCHECAAELGVLRDYMASESPVVESLAARARRVVAQLFSPPATGGAFALGLRGSDTTASTIFRVEDVSVSLIQGPGEGELTGMVARDITGPETLVGAEIYLVNADGARQVATVGPAGDFGIAALPAGAYELELRLFDRVVVIPGVHFDHH
jgi:hypothetical protein